MSTLNPFYWKGPIEEQNTIVGRDVFALEITEKLKSGHNLALFAPRRAGKTTFALRLAQELKQSQSEDAPAFTTIYVDFQRAISIRTAIGCLAKAIEDKRSRFSGFSSRDAERALTTVEKEAGFSFKTLSYKTKMSKIQALQADENLFHSILDSLKNLDSHMVIILDEFQRLGSCPGRPLWTIRSALMGPGSQHVSLFLTGSIRQAMKELLTDSNGPFFEQVEQVELPRIVHSDFADFLEFNFEATGKTLKEDTADYLLSLTKCHPHRTQQLAHKTWELVKHGSEIDKEVVQEAFEIILQSLEGAFIEKESEAFNGKPVEEHALRVLYLLAKSGGDGATSEDSLVAYGFTSPNEFYRGRDYLVRKGIVEHEINNDEFIIVDPLFEEWIHRNMPV